MTPLDRWLVQLALAIEQHYGAPQDGEWWS